MTAGNAALGLCNTVQFLLQPAGFWTRAAKGRHPWDWPLDSPCGPGAHARALRVGCALLQLAASAGSPGRGQEGHRGGHRLPGWPLRSAR